MYKQEQLTALLADRRILIAGYGREGQSTHALLRRLLPEAPVDIARNDEEIFACLAKTSYDSIIKSPGIPTMKFEGRCDLDTITSQTDLFLQVYGSQTLAVTGTKGKSTTTTLLHHLLRNSFPERNVVLAGNMGIPLFDILDQLDERSLVVAEFSCHQLENIHRGPHIGILLNLYQEHLDHYHDYHGYQMAKMQMVLRMDEHDHCFYCTDSHDLQAIVEQQESNISATLHPYSLSTAQHSPIAQWKTSLCGDHNLCNIYAAVSAARLAGAPEKSLQDALTTFKGLPHRLELVGTYNNGLSARTPGQPGHRVTFYNDSISTIPEATIAAIEALQKVNTLILGGFDRGIDYHILGDFLRQNPLGQQVQNIVFVGQAGRRMMQEWDLPDRNTLVEDDYTLIVPWCYTFTESDRICLLSPAAASYDAFKNFEERGDTFKKLVESIPEGNDGLSPWADIRHDLHDHPQTAGNEQYAHDLIVSHLQELHPDKVYTHVGGYGVIAFWGEEPSAPTIAFRADIDALPTGHHCGHDGHTTILLRLAELIDKDVHGSTPLLLIWQPAEETGEGARAVLETGILQQYNIKSIYALHNLPGYPLGTVVLCPRTFAAASTGVIYHLQGRETHASTPEMGINPGLAVAEIIDRFNGLNVVNGEFRQSTLICVRVGELAFGTSAGEAEVMFTLRAFTNGAMEQLLAEANAAVDEIAARHKLKVDRILREPFRATENNGDCVETIEKAAEEVPLRVRYQMEPNRWSEDFAEYLVHFKGAMFGIGSGENHAELHHPDYDFPDELIEPAARVFFSLIPFQNKSTH